MKENVHPKGHFTLHCTTFDTPFKRRVNLFLSRLPFSFLQRYWLQKFGVVKWADSFNNGITNAGLAQLALLAGDASAVPFTYLAVGTSTTAFAVGQTTLGAEITTGGLERAAATVSRTTTSVSNDTLSLVKTWTSSATHAVEEIGAFNASSAGTMLCRALPVATKNVVSGETLAATYTISFA